jgi:hypothetical protein
MNARLVYLLSAAAATLLLTAPASHAQGERAFCQERADGIYVHPDCSYIYKCSNKSTFEIPTIPGHLIATTQPQPGFPTAEPTGSCGQDANGVYAGAACRTYTQCVDNHPFQILRPANSRLGDIPAAK